MISNSTIGGTQTPCVACRRGEKLINKTTTICPSNDFEEKLYSIRSGLGGDPDPDPESRRISGRDGIRDPNSPSTLDESDGVFSNHFESGIIAKEGWELAGALRYHMVHRTPPIPLLQSPQQQKRAVFQNLQALPKFPFYEKSYYPVRPLRIGLQPLIGTTR